MIGNPSQATFRLTVQNGAGKTFPDDWMDYSMFYINDNHEFFRTGLPENP